MGTYLRHHLYLRRYRGRYVLKATHVKTISQHQKLNHNIKSIITSEQFDTLLMFIPQAATVGVL